MSWPIPPKEPDLNEVLRVIQRGREHAQVVHGDLKIHDDCATCVEYARELHSLSGRSGTFEQDMSQFRAKQRQARAAGKPGKIKQSIPRVGDIEDIMPQIMAHDRVAHHSDGEVHLDCAQCKEFCRQCLQSIGMTPQDYLDSFDLMPMMSDDGGSIRPEVLKEIAIELVREAATRVANPWSYIKTEVS